MPYSSTPASTACETASSRRHPLTDTCDQLIRQQLPNFFRLYLNPFVVQTCYCLSKYVQSTWAGARKLDHQSFLANSFDEALSGAIKLARYSAGLEHRSQTGLVLDRGGRLGHFASVLIDSRDRIEFVPKLTVVTQQDERVDTMLSSRDRLGFIALVGVPDREDDALRTLIRQQAPLIVLCVSRGDLAAWRQQPPQWLGEIVPDIVVFDESFVNHAVPFAAFTARKALYACWNQMGQATFHSTTYQPNTIASAHFLNCLKQADSEFYATTAAERERIQRDPGYCASLLAALYSPFLARAITTLGFDTAHVRATGSYVVTEGRRVFDGVAGVACSMRGHNPPTYVDEMESMRDEQVSPQLLTEKLTALTRLEHLLPAVSGATAVENALRIGLVAQFPKKYVLAFKGGFGGKTLLALTCTAQSSYKTHLGPLYEHVIYIDAFAPNVIGELESALDRHLVAIVQLELIQAVGGVRAMPTHVVRYLEEHKRRWGYLLLVDEVQTGMYRTGSFIRSDQVGITPDLLTLGKAASDMMFPVALTLYSSAIERRLHEVQPDLPRAIRRQYDYEFGYKTVLNGLRYADRAGIPDRVTEAGALFAALLKEGLASSKVVRDIRVFGLLIAIELDTDCWPLRFFRKQVALVYMLGLLRHAPFPLLVGFCQYEPNVLKLTPPLSITSTEVRQICTTITTVLNKSPYKLLLGCLGTLVKSYLRRTRGRVGNRD